MPAPLEAADDADLRSRLLDADQRLAALEAERAELMLSDPAADDTDDDFTGIARRAAQLQAYLELLGQRAVLAAQLMGAKGSGPALG